MPRHALSAAVLSQTFSLQVPPLRQKRSAVLHDPTQCNPSHPGWRLARQDRSVSNRNQHLEFARNDMDVRRIVIFEIHSDLKTGKSRKRWHCCKIYMADYAGIQDKYGIICRIFEPWPSGPRSATRAAASRAAETASPRPATRVVVRRSSRDRQRWRAG